MHRSPRTLLLTLVGATLLVVPTAAAAAPPDRAGPPPGTRGVAAIAELDDRLPGVARANGMSATRLRTLLRTDDTLHVDDTDRLFYVRPAAPPAVRADRGEAVAVAALATSFDLHSRPGANRTIFLDFDGYQLPDGTAWSRQRLPRRPVRHQQRPRHLLGRRVGRRPVGLGARRRRRRALRRRRDHRGPGIDAIRRSGSGDQVYGTRVVITDESTNCGCGGVAYLGVFDVTGSTHDHYQPAWVSTQGVGDGTHNIAEAASHEAGHNLGLDHDGTSNQGYDAGHGAWAPIMGVGYYEPITQWRRGEYAGANNTENDWAVMAGNGAPPLADDHGGASSPTSLGSSGTVATSGTITPRDTSSYGNDVDAFAFSAGARAATFTASPSEVLPNLDIALTLRTIGGTVVATANPVSGEVNGDRASGLAATPTTNLAAGDHVLEVDGVGAHSPATTGYSDYGSVGPHTLPGSHAPGGGGGGNQAPTASAAATPPGPHR